MKKIPLIFLFILFITMGDIKSQDKESVVLIETSYGNIKLKLYNETPLHRDNFLKLIGEGFYKDLLFHRVIKDFMIQGGDPSSRTASASVSLGGGDLAYTIPAEFRIPQYFHKKGALAAARIGDDVNPEKASSASQFYIVTGKKLSDKDLKNMEKQRIERQKQVLFNELQVLHRPTIKELYSNGDRETLAELRTNLYQEVEEEVKEREVEFLFTPEQREAYKEVGGTPFLDGEYTVFGEVIEGMDIVEKIQDQKTKTGDRPVEDIRMDIKIVSE